MNDFWIKQTKDAPAFKDLLWGRPENKLHAGKLLIIGGNGYEFKAPANTYGDALEAGIGVAKVLLPTSMQKVVHDIFPEAEFAPSTPSGSFASQALAQIIDLAHWADGVILPGDIGSNSETAVLIETFLAKFDRQVTLSGDAVDHFINQSAALLNRTDTTLVLTFAQTQKILAKAGVALTHDMGLVKLVDELARISRDHQANIVVLYHDTAIVAINGQISTTLTDQSTEKIAADSAVWWLQNPLKPFEAITTSLAA